MSMYSIWRPDGGFVGIGEITSRGTSPFNFVEARFCDGTTDRFDDLNPDPSKWAYGMVFLSPDERPKDATEDGIARHAEWLARWRAS